MSEKQELIKKMLEMQKRFIAYEQEHGLDPEEYYVPAENHPLHNYRQEYKEAAMRVVELAHAEKGSRS
ncbi:hypothetical protein HUS23_09580 [Ectothiorhodospiraceae bacterium 2226]|nr:hypothetical protein HUS23_09580 [Ectothiorhodospiraceae bacterium 2226]